MNSIGASGRDGPRHQQRREGGQQAPRVGAGAGIDDHRLEGAAAPMMHSSAIEQAVSRMR